MLLACLLASAPADGDAEGGPTREERLQSVQQEILRLERDLRKLEGEREGLLGDLARIEAQASLRAAEVRRLSIEREATEEALARQSELTGEVAREVAQGEQRLTSRLRSLYRQGPLGHHRLLLAADEPAEMLDALRVARQATRRDMRALTDYRESRDRLAASREELAARRDELAAGEAAAAAARRRLARAREERERMLVRVEEDRTVRGAALGELQLAKEALAGVVGGLGGEVPDLDMAAFRGLLDWPVPGEVMVAFGDQEHPRFGTTVPHPGWDLKAPYGATIAAVFDGRVVFAEWFRGYGLTMILDHGGGYLSVYAHASALLAEKGRDVLRGQTIALVGDTGSLKGPYVYFEIRRDGAPEDPAAWLMPGR